jgi:hypothetical protein
VIDKACSHIRSQSTPLQISNNYHKRKSLIFLARVNKNSEGEKERDSFARELRLNYDGILDLTAFVILYAKNSILAQYL